MLKVTIRFGKTGVQKVGPATFALMKTWTMHDGHVRWWRGGLTLTITLHEAEEPPTWFLDTLRLAKLASADVKTRQKARRGSHGL